MRLDDTASIRELNKRIAELNARTIAPAPSGAPLVLPSAEPAPGFAPLSSGLLVRVSPFADLDARPGLVLPDGPSPEIAPASSSEVHALIAEPVRLYVPTPSEARKLLARDLDSWR